VVRQEVVIPIEQPADESIWRSREGAVYSTMDLAAYCMKLLSTEMGAAKG
jgi:hypothetical protein